MLRPSSLGGSNMNTGGLSSIGMNMNMSSSGGNQQGGNMGGGMMNPGGMSNMSSGGGVSGMPSRLVSPRHAVHIIWDIEHVGVPSGASEVWVISSLVALAERECQGYVESFVACCHEGYLDLKTKRELQDAGVAIEEVHVRRPTDNYILTRLLALSLQLSLHRTAAAAAPPAIPSLLQLAGSQSSFASHQAAAAVARPILIMITGERDLARALHIIRQSSLFQEIVLLHPPMHDSGDVLRQAATQAVEWLSFLSLNQLAQQQVGIGGGNIGAGRLTPLGNLQQQAAQQAPLLSLAQSQSPMMNPPPGLGQRSRVPIAPGGPQQQTSGGSAHTTPETRYRGVSTGSTGSGSGGETSSPAVTPPAIDENRPMGGRGDWPAWQDKTEKLRVQHHAHGQAASGASGTVTTPPSGSEQQHGGGGGRSRATSKADSENWRTASSSAPGTPSSQNSGGGKENHKDSHKDSHKDAHKDKDHHGSNNNNNNGGHEMPPPYRTPYQREMQRRLHPAAGAASSSSSSPGSSPLASPPSPGDVRISDERDYYDQQHQRVNTAADLLRDKEAAAWEQQQHQAGGGRSRSSSTASVSGRLISLDEQHHPTSGSSSGGHSTPTSGSGTPTGSVSYAQVLGKGSTPVSSTTTITPRTGSASAPTTPTGGASGSASGGARTPAQSARGRPDRATLAVRLFSHVMGVCADEKIIPRESVIRSKLEDTSVWDSTKKDQQQAPAGLKSWPSLHMEFESWLDMVQQKKACVCVGVSPQRVLWPCPPQARFECADYFRPQERLNAAEMTQLVEFLAMDQHRGGHEQHHHSQGSSGGGQVDRGRYGFANYLKSCGPPFVRDMPRGYVVELVQLLLNKNFLQFRKGKVSFRSTAAGRWKRALESVQASGLGGVPSLDDGATGDNGDNNDAAAMDEEHAMMSSTASSRSSQSSAASSSSSSSGIGSNSTGGSGDGSLLITSTRPGAKSSSTSLLTTITSGSSKAPSPYPPARAASSSPDSSSESSSQAMRRASMNRATSGGGPMMEGRPRAATMPSDSKSGSKMMVRGPTPPVSGAAGGASSSSPAVGPSLDFDDPVELLAVKCNEAPSPILSSSTMALILKRESLAEGVTHAFWPLYHFEKSGEQHAPLWVCVITLDLRYPIGRQPVGTVATTSLIAPSSASFPPLTGAGSTLAAVPQRPKRFRSTRKAKKLEAQQEAAMRAIESGYWNEAFQPPVAEGAKPIYPPVKDYVANIIDDPVVILDRLLITLEQAPAVYSMESAITQHGSGSRTMWTCGVQLALRPRPAHLTTGTISMEQAENGEMPTTTSDDSPSVRYPTIKFQASQAKKFDAKGLVAAHVLQVLEKSRHKYPMLFQATPEPLPPRPKTLLMPSMIPPSSPAQQHSGGMQQASAPSPSPPPPQAVPLAKPPSPIIMPQRTRDRASAVTTPPAGHAGSSSSSSNVVNVSSSSAAAQYHAAQQHAHQLLVAQQAQQAQQQQQQHHHQQQMLQQQQAQQYGHSPVVTMVPHPPPIPPSYVPAPLTSPPNSSRVPILRATANEWQPSSVSSSSATAPMMMSGSNSDSGASSSAAQLAPSPSAMMPSPPPPSSSSSPPRPSPTGSSGGGAFDRLQRIPMIRTFLSNLTSPSSSASSGGRFITPSTVVASEHSGMPSSSAAASSSSGSSSGASSPQVPSSINVMVAPPNKSPSGSPSLGMRAITPPGQNLRAYVSPMGRTRPVSESALGLGGIQWEHQSQSPVPIGGTGASSSSGSSSGMSSGGSSSARSAPRRLAEHGEDENMRAMRRSVDDLLKDTNTTSNTTIASTMPKSTNSNDNMSSSNTKNNNNTNSSNNNNNGNANNKNNAAGNDSITMTKSGNDNNTTMMNDGNNDSTNVKNTMAGNKNESRALKIPSPVRNDPLLPSPSASAASGNNDDRSGSASPIPSSLASSSSSASSSALSSNDEHHDDHTHACHAM